MSPFINTRIGGVLKNVMIPLLMIELDQPVNLFPHPVPDYMESASNKYYTRLLPCLFYSMGKKNKRLT
ncbi:MAG: hypothetical protein A2277_00480 [Desulfobacterales bacterium RIFOXYA12_FULL_46_15]|nr:MAG: hypothetical protein A2277_00480 [Desulfobacterales bacterium RIFOXYA12_FULL_46_15]